MDYRIAQLEFQIPMRGCEYLSTQQAADLREVPNPHEGL